MRHLLVLVLLAACKDKPARKPDPQRFAAMTSEVKCEATVPRVIPCIDELIVQQVAKVDREMAAAIDKDLRGTKNDDDDGSAEMHRVNCRASKSYADAVFACWEQPDCRAFAVCVVEKDVGPPP